MEENPERKKCCTCPARRYYISFMMLVGYVLLYSTRVNLSVAIVFMTAKKTTAQNGTESTEREFDWDEEHQSYALASFFYGYIVTQLPGGYLAGAIGGTYILAIGVVGSGLLSFIVPVAALNSFAALIVVRVACGLFQGMTIPAANAIMSKWAPLYERTILSGIAISGNFMSPVIVMPICNEIGRYIGWEWMFYIFGMASCLWGIIWLSTSAPAPAKDMFITRTELDYIQTSIGPDNSAKFTPPWKHIFGSTPVWAVIVAHTAHNWGYYTVLLYGPKFFKETEKYETTMAVFFASCGFFVLYILLTICSILADVLRSKTKLSTVVVRKIFTSGGFAFQAVSMVVASLVYIKPVTVAAVILGVGFGGSTWAGFYPNPLDIATPHAAVITGVSNTFGTLPGIISPYITGQIIPDENPTTPDWLWVWMICGILYAIGGVFYAIFARGETQSWVNNNPEV